MRKNKKVCDSYDGFLPSTCRADWFDGMEGKSNFKRWKWLPHYLHWYFAAIYFGIKNIIIKKWRSILSWSVLLLAVCWNFYQVFCLAVDVPFWDEWDYLPCVENFNWQNLMAVHVQHRIVFTRILFYLSFLWDSLNIRHLIIFNWFIYLFFAVFTMRLFFRYFQDFEWYPLFFLPFFSELPYQNLLWAGQSSFHLMLLFGMLALDFGFQKPPSYRNTLIFSVFLVLSIFSLTPAMAMIFFFVWCMRSGWLFLHQSEDRTRIFSFRSFLLAALITGGGVLLFFINYVAPGPNLSDFTFGDFIRSSCVSFFQCYNWIPVHRLSYCSPGLRYVWYFLITLSFICFLCVVLPRWKELITKNGSAVAIILWSFTFIVMIAFFRHGSIAERHTEAVLPAVPAFASCFAMISNAKLRKIALCHYLIGLLISLSFAFSFHLAENEIEDRKQSIKLLRQWKQNPETELKIPILYPDNFSEQGERAKRLNISCLK